MTILLSSLPDATLRSICREKVESLEFWLRRIVEDLLRPQYNDYFAYSDVHGKRLMRKELAESIVRRHELNPERYPRIIDAALLDDVVAIVCNPQLYDQHFRAAFHYAFPQGRETARVYFKRIVAHRNNLSHANAISSRAVEQIVCYSNDITDGLKEYYRSRGMHEEYDVPLFLSFRDSFGNEVYRPTTVGGPSLFSHAFTNNLRFALRPGDTRVVDAEVDQAYPASDYKLNWGNSNGPMLLDAGRRYCLTINLEHVGLSFAVWCQLITNRPWHKTGNIDDHLHIKYKVLPPIG
jgi:hypothetical protein